MKSTIITLLFLGFALISFGQTPANASMDKIADRVVAQMDAKANLTTDQETQVREMFMNKFGYMDSMTAKQRKVEFKTAVPALLIDVETILTTEQMTLLEPNKIRLLKNL